MPFKVVELGTPVAIGGPGAINFLGNQVMDVYIAPHRLRIGGDQLKLEAVHRSRVKSDADGTLDRTDVWRADRPGKFDVVVDYDGNGTFDWRLDAIMAIVVVDRATSEFTLAADDHYTGRHGRLIVLRRPGVLANDRNSLGKPVSARLLVEPKQGAVDFQADGALVYRPRARFVGFDRFAYEAVASNGSRDRAEVLFELTNAEPLVVEDKFVVRQGATLKVASPGLLSNDVDFDKDGLKAVLASPPQYGRLDLKADGSFTYTPDPAFVGEDRFTYSCTDGIAKSYSGLVRIVVQAGHKAPVEQPAR